MSNYSTEKRRARRATVSIPFKIGGDKYDWLMTETVNLSSIGAYCSVEEYIPVNTKVAITMIVPDPADDKGNSTVIDCYAIVVRSEKAENHYNAALFFTGISNENRDALERYIHSKVEEGAEAAE